MCQLIVIVGQVDPNMWQRFASWKAMYLADSSCSKIPEFQEIMQKYEKDDNDSWDLSGAKRKMCKAIHDFFKDVASLDYDFIRQYLAKWYCRTFGINGAPFSYEYQEFISSDMYSPMN